VMSLGSFVTSYFEEVNESKKYVSDSAMHRNSFWLRCIHDIRVADGTHQTLVRTWRIGNRHYLQISHKYWQLTICPIATPRFVFWRRSKLCQVRVPRSWQLASRCQMFSSQVLLSGPVRRKWRGARSGL